METQKITVRKAKERGHANYGWLNTYHTFSFGDYYDPKFTGFRTLRVINDDTVKPAMGFVAHRHTNMEILSYIIDGALEHKDSLGNGSIIRKGSIQRMSAGSGIEHSEFNPSSNQSAHFLQIWILPEPIGINPSYEEMSIGQVQDQCVLIAAQNPPPNALKIHQDVRVYFGRLNEYRTLTHTIDRNRGVWIQMIHGKLKLNDHVVLDQGDGAGIENESTMHITTLTDAEFLLFDSI